LIFYGDAYRLQKAGLKSRGELRVSFRENKKKMRLLRLPVYGRRGVICLIPLARNTK
jgi:hypothetical protein